MAKDQLSIVEPDSYDYFATIGSTAGQYRGYSFFLIHNNWRYKHLACQKHVLVVLIWLTDQVIYSTVLGFQAGNLVGCSIVSSSIWH